MGADHAQRAGVTPLALGLQPLFDVGDHVFAVRAAHQGRQVQRAFGHEALQLSRRLARIDDGQHAILGAELCSNVGPRGGGGPVGRQLHLHALQGGKQGIGVVDDFAHVVQPAQVLAGVKVIAVAQGWLRGGAQHHGDAVVRHQQLEHVQNGLQKRRGQLLRLVQHDDAAHQVVQLAAARGFGGKERFEQLHVGGDDQRCVPVLAGQAAAGGFVFFGSVGLAVVFDQYLVAQGLEHVTEHICCLLDDAGVGDGVDDAALAVGLCVLQSKRQAGEGFAPTRGHREREEARWQGSLGAALAQDVGAQRVDGRGGHRQRSHVGIECLTHLRQGGEASAAGGFARIKVRFRVQKVGIDQA